MFRNQTLQRTVASLLIASFATGLAAPIAAAETAPLVGTLPLISLQASQGHGNGQPKLDENGIPTGKGVKNSRTTVAAPVQAATLPGQGYGHALAALHELSRSAAVQLAAGKGDALAMVNAARSAYAAVLRQDADIAASFAATESFLRARGVPAEILQRHAAAVGEYASRNAGLRTAMLALDNAAAGKASAQTALAQLDQLLAQFPSQSGQHGRGKGALPWGQARKLAQKVALTPREHETRFPRSLQLAAAGSLSGISLPDAVLPPEVQPADLAPGEETPATPEIVALAASLGNNPVSIHNWVRSQVRFAPGFGAMQGAAATLQARRGNDVDTASLLIALYRAAGIPARYAYGTIEVPAARINNWLGVDNMAAAMSLLTQAGVPNRANGQAVQLEHVWVEAYVDYSPSRAAVNKAASAWVALDPSFKQMDKQAGMDLRSAVSLNEAGLFDAVKQGASCTMDYARNLNITSLQQGYTSYKGALETYLGQQGGDLTVGQVLGRSAVAPENYSILLGSLPYKTVAEGTVVNVLPEQLRWKFRVQLFANAADQGADKSTAAFSASLSSVGSKRLTLSFVPATQADADTLAAYLPRAHADNSPVQPAEFPAEIPGYLIRVKAEIRLDGAVVASGGSFVLGSELVADIGAFDPATGNWNDSSFYPNAGDYHAVAIDAQGVNAGQLNALKSRLNAVQAKLAAGQGASLTRDEVAGELLYQGALSYFATVDANGAVFQRAAGVVEQRLPSYGRAVAQVRPQMVLGIVNKVSFPGVTLDIDRASSAVASQNAGLASAAYVRQSNERNAAYAHQVLARLFTHAQLAGQAVSTVRSLSAAAAAGQPIFAVTSANSAAVLPQVSLTASAATELQDDLTAGYRALVAQSPVTIGGWTGQGVATEDPPSGAGSFRLSGEAGNATAALYTTGGMGWLALANPAVSGAALAPVAQAGQAMDATLAAMLDEAGDTTRWSFFPGQAEVLNGLFLSRLNAAQGAGPCDSVTGILAANLGTAASFDGGSVAGAPVITSAPVIAAGAAQLYQYAVIATDPQGAALAYSLAGAPTGMAISDTGVIAWAKPVAGTYNVTVRADNGRAYAEQRYQLTVGAQALELTATLVATPAVVNLGDTVDIDFVTNGGTGSIARTITVDGQAVAVDVNGHASVIAQTKGAHQIAASATDSIRTVTRAATYSVRDLADSTLPVAMIDSPADDAEVTGPVNVIGSASATNMAYYQLLLRPSGSSAWNEIARGTSPVSSGVLGKLDPTQLANGIYELVLMVADANGNKQSYMRTVDIYRDLKIGQFSITFEDLNVEASGIPIRVTRTYDTRKKADSMDFGYGWSVDYQNVQIRKNMVLGLQWIVQVRQFLLCVVPTGKRKINVTLPGGKVERFSAALEKECEFGTIPPVDVKLTPLPGTTSRLEVIKNTLVEARGGVLYDMDNFEPWNPKDYKLTTADNYVYYLTDGVGITQVRDPAGNTLTYGLNGIVHSNGQSVAFTRDANKRITAVSDPAGKRIRYSYDGAGDLVTVTDRVDAVSKFSYNRSHGLTEFTDPMGRLAARYVYDDDGRVVAMYDAEGKAVEMNHDTVNNKEIVKDRRGFVTTYTYDGAGNVTEKVDALQRTTKYAYDALGNVTALTDANGKTTSSVYDLNSGMLLSQKDPLGNTVTLSYDPETRIQLQKTTDARNNVTSYTYSESGSEGVNEPLGRTTFLKMNGKNLERVTIAGQVTTFTYDAKGNKLSETDAAGNVTTFAYDANNKEVSRSWVRVIDGVSKTVTLARKLDAEGRVLEETDELGYVTKHSYNAGGQRLSTTDPQGRVTRFEYDVRGKLARTTWPDNSSESFTYDAEGNKVTATDRQGRVSKFEYDPLNRLTTTIHPDGSSSGFEYDPVGRVSVTIDANKNRFVNTYDDAGRLETVTDPDQRVTRFGYDENGNRTSVTDANLQVTAYKYDALNRLVEVKMPDGRTSSVVWNVNGTKQSETDLGGNTVAYGYDAMARLETVTQTNGATSLKTQYKYDGQGNKLSQTDAEGHVTLWTYDLANRPSSRQLPGGQVERYSYNEHGDMTSRVDFAGQTTRYSYGPTGETTQEIRPDGVSIVYTYTPNGQVESATVTGNGGVRSGKTSYSYDAADRIVRQVNPDGAVLGFAYDLNGNISERSTAAGTVRYGYDSSQRLASVTGHDGKVTRYKYTPTGQLESAALPNGTTALHSYDASGRLIQLLHLRADGSVVSGTRYAFKANNQRETVSEFDAQSTVAGGLAQDPVRTTKYAYDPTGRLVQEQVSVRGGGVERTVDFTYDNVGNRSGQTVSTGGSVETTGYTYDSNDRLTQESKSSGAGPAIVTSYTWDDKGNLRSKASGNAASFYTWTSDNRLLSVTTGSTEATAQLVARYVYDANGNRVAKIEPGSNGQPEKVTNYLVDDTFAYSQVVQEDIVQGGTSERASFVWGANLIQQTRGARTSYIHTDVLGSTKALTDANGTVTGSYRYDAFGRMLDHLGTDDTDYRFAGEYADASTGLQYNRARWYDAQAGRFMSVDAFPSSDNRPATHNRYLYVADDPVNTTDPSGLFSLGELNAAMNEIGAMSTRIAINFGRGAANIGGRLMNQMGTKAQQWVEKIVEQCLKPKKMNKNVRINDKGSKRQLDLVVELEEAFLNIESKSKIPNVGSAALRRLKQQLLEAQQMGKKVVVVGADKVSNERLQAVVAYLKRGGVKTGSADLEIINGLVSFAVWIGEVYGEECLGL